MAQKISIVIDDHNDGTTCTAQYNIRYRLSGTTPWTDLEPQYDSPVVLSNLADSATYDYSITRSCCDGPVSPAATGTFTTGS